MDKLLSALLLLETFQFKLQKLLGSLFPQFPGRNVELRKDTDDACIRTAH